MITKSALGDLDAEDGLGIEINETQPGKQITWSLGANTTTTTSNKIIN